MSIEKLMKFKRMAYIEKFLEFTPNINDGP